MKLTNSSYCLLAALLHTASIHSMNELLLSKKMLNLGTFSNPLHHYRIPTCQLITPLTIHDAEPIVDDETHEESILIAASTQTEHCSMELNMHTGELRSDEYDTIRSAICANGFFITCNDGIILDNNNRLNICAAVKDDAEISFRTTTQIILSKIINNADQITISVGKFNPSGKIFAYAVNQKNNTLPSYLKFIDFDNSLQRVTPLKIQGVINVIDYAPTNNILALGCSHGLILFNTKTEQAQRLLKNSITALCYISNEQLAYATHDTIALYDCTKGYSTIVAPLGNWSCKKLRYSAIAKKLLAIAEVKEQAFTTDNNVGTHALLVMCEQIHSHFPLLLLFQKKLLCDISIITNNSN